MFHSLDLSEKKRMRRSRKPRANKKNRMVRVRGWRRWGWRGKNARRRSPGCGERKKRRGEEERVWEAGMRVLEQKRTGEREKERKGEWELQ